MSRVRPRVAASAEAGYHHERLSCLPNPAPSVDVAGPHAPVQELRETDRSPARSSVEHMQGVPMSQGHWAAVSDRVLSVMFRKGIPAPTRLELMDAYPFGERAMWPYKAWCERVKAWRAAHAAGQSRPIDHVRRRAVEANDHETGNLFEDAR